MPFWVLTILGFGLWGMGYMGCMVADRFRIPRLVGGIGLFVLLGHVASGYGPGDLSWSTRPLRAQIETLERDRAAERERLAATGVTGVAIDEFDAETRLRIASIEEEIRFAAGRDRAIVQYAIGFPVLMVALGMGLWQSPRREGFARRLPFVLAGSVLAGAVALGMGWTFVELGWFETGEIPAWTWLGGLAIGCAVTGLPRNREDTSADPLWRNVFEPLLYAYCASQMDLRGAFDVWLFVFVLILYTDVKALGAVLLRRFVTRDSWWGSLVIGCTVVRAGPFAIGVAVALQTAGMVDAALFTALVFSMLFAACVAPAITQWARGATTQSQSADSGG